MSPPSQTPWTLLTLRLFTIWSHNRWTSKHKGHTARTQRRPPAESWSSNWPPWLSFHVLLSRSEDIHRFRTSAQISWSPADPAAPTPDPSPQNPIPRAQRSMRAQHGEGWPPMQERESGCRVWTRPSTACAKWSHSGARTKSCPNMRPCRWPSATSWPSTGSWQMPGSTVLLTGSGWTCSLTVYSLRTIHASWHTTPPLDRSTSTLRSHISSMAIRSTRKLWFR